LYALAAELGMTVQQLSSTVTQEELIGWAAYFDLKKEYEDRAAERNRQNSKAATMRSK